MVNQFLFRGWVRVYALTLLLSPVYTLMGQTSMPAPLAPGADAANLSPAEEAHILKAIESKNGASGAATLDLEGAVTPTLTPAGTPSQAVTSNSTVPASSAGTSVDSSATPQPPTGLSVLILKEGVYLSWDASSSPSATYNVYRSMTPGSDYRQINLKSLTAPYFLDGVPSSISPPSNGENYFYVVAVADSQGRLSDYSDEIYIAPLGMEIPETEEGKKAAKNGPVSGAGEEELKVPEQKILSLSLPADTQLSIQGYKKIEADFSFQKFNRQDQNGIPSEVDSTLVNQEMVVNLEGKVGKNVDVHVDYSDVNRAGGVDQSKQEISIVYHGESNSPVQEVSFGDLQMNLPNTEFAGFSKQLFGLQAKLKFDDFRVTAFFAQTKGIAETRVFSGNTGQVDKIFNDIDYIRQRYYLITKEVIPGVSNGVSQNIALPQPNSEQIWVNAGTGQSTLATGSNFIGPFEHWLPGRDYIVDYSTGIITFIRGLSSNAQVVVGFTNKNNGQRGLNVPSIGTAVLSNNNAISNFQVSPNGIITDGNSNTNYTLIKNNNNTTSTLYLVDYYDLGRDKIIPPQQDPNFVFQVIDQGTNNVLQTGQGGLGSASQPWAYVMNQDFNYLVVMNTNNMSVPVTTGGTANFSERAFVDPNVDSTLGTATNGIYNETTVPNSLKRIHLVYKTQLNYYQLNRFNIIRASETVFLDGRRLRRDVDYTLDYTSGFLDFPDKSILRPDSQLVISYEYAPFGSFSQNNILGTRLEYDVTDHLFIGSTFLNSTSQQPQDMPQIGSTPNSLTVLDADMKYDMGPDELQGLTGFLPGLSNWRPPFTVKLSGEIAESYYNPDTYNMEGEIGVAMVDNMEGIDSVTGPTMNATNWIAASSPEQVGFLGSVPYDSGSTNAINNRVRFRNGSIEFTTAAAAVTSGETVLPGYGGHIYAGVLGNPGTGNGPDAIPVLQVPYANLTNQFWAGVRQTLSATGLDLSNTTYMQAWVYNDGQPKWIMIDFGVMSEAINSDQGSNIEAEQLPLTPQDDFGLLTNYFNPLTGLNGPASQIGGGGISITDESQGTQEGQGNNILDTEDTNGDGILEGAGSDAYYEYGIQANWTGWQIVKVPVNFSQPDGQFTTDQGVNYFFHTTSSLATPTLIRTIRFWMTGADSTPRSGYVLFENIQFNHNLWQLEVDPGAVADQALTINTQKFDVTSISQDQDPGYQPTTRFIVIPSGTNTSSILAKEKSLKITYDLSDTDFDPQFDVSGNPIYYATRFFNQGVDFTDYLNMAFDLYVRTTNIKLGEVLFIRIGNDQQNYYQYNIPLLPQYQSNWNSISVQLDGSGGNRKTVGTPFINRATQISFGVLSPNHEDGLTKELWINNLRVNTPSQRSGLARRANATFVFGNNFATVNTRYREVDSGFTQIDQTSNHFQHSTQYGVDYTSNGVKLFNQPLATQFSYTSQNQYTETALLQNPYFSALPNAQTQNTTGSISYTKDLGTEWGRLTNFRLSESTYDETDIYQTAYLTQPGIQGNTEKANQTYTVASTYDAPSKIVGFPIGSNQLTETFILSYDTQEFLSSAITGLSNYSRTTENGTYGWTNATEVLKNLVFTPGYSLNLVDAMGNTNSPGVAGSVPQFVNFQERDQPKAGLTYRGIPGAIPSVNYTGSAQVDNVTYPEGPRLNTSDSINYSLNLSPSVWWDTLKKFNLSAFAGRTENASSAVPDFRAVRPLGFEEVWGIDPPNDVALNSTKSITDQINFSFKLFDIWDFKPTGSWTTQFNLLSAGTTPVEQDSDTLGFTTVYNSKLLTLPYINFGFDSAQFQYTRTDSTQWDSSSPPQVSGQSANETFAFTVPYDIAKQSQGNIRYQHTDGFTSTNGIVTDMVDDQYSIQYNQKFLENEILHIPFTHWKIKFDQAIELQVSFLAEFVNNLSPNYALNNLQTEKYRGTVQLNYNALKNLRIGLGFVNEYFIEDNPYPYLGYTLWQINLSGEARF